MKMKVSPANRDLERLRPYLKVVFESPNVRQRETAAKLNNQDATFQDGTSKALFDFLIASIAAVHRVSLADRKMTAQECKRRRAATQIIAAACRLWRPHDPPDYLYRARLKAITKVLRSKILRKLGSSSPVGGNIAHLVNSSKLLRSNTTVPRDERCGGALADLIEESYLQAGKIWNASGFETRLAAPTNKSARLDYARKTLQQNRTVTPKV